MRIALLAATVGLSGVVGCAAWRLPDEPRLTEYAVTQRVLPLKSGMTVVVQRDDGTPLVGVAWTVKAGGTSDPYGVEGLAHLVEHLAFRSRPAGGPQVWDHLKRMGAAFNAWTSADMTGYFTIAHKRFLPQVLQLEAWRMAHTLEGVTPEVFEVEREVVRNELRQRNETTVGGRLFDRLLGTLFPEGHSLHRPLAGTHESLSAIRLANAIAFARRHYRPRNISVSVVGDVDPDEVARLVGTWPERLLFGPGGPDGPAVAPEPPLNARPAPEVPPPVTTALQRDRGPIAEPLLLLAWSGPPGHRGNNALLSAVADRLNVALSTGVERKEEDPLEGMSASAIPFQAASVILVQAQLRPGADPERERARLLNAVGNAAAAQHEFSVPLNRFLVEGGRWFRATSVLQSVTSPLAVGIETATYLASTGKTTLFTETFNELASVRMNAVTAFIHQWIRRDRAVSVFFEPESDRMPELAVARGGAGAGGRRDGDVHERARGEVLEGADLGPERIAEIAGSPGLGRLPRERLPNGIELIAARTSRIPFAQLWLQLPGGNATTRPYGFASFARRYSRQTCFDHGDLDAVAGWLSGGMGEVTSTVSGSAPSGNLVNLIAALSDHVACREVNEEAFLHRHEHRKELRKYRERRLKRPEFLARQKLMAALYPDHVFGIVDVDPDSFASVGEEDITAFLRGHYRPDEALMLVAGDVDPGEVQRLASQYLQRWARGSAAGRPGVPRAAFPEGRRMFLVDRPKATQASILAGCRLEDATPESLPALDLVEATAGELAWAIREEWGATYGIHASVTAQPGGAAHLVMGGAVENAHAGRALAQLLAILETVGSEELAEGLFLRERLDVAIAFATRFVGSDGMASAILSARRHGWPLDVWDRYGERLAATTRADLQRAMKPCLGREIVTVVGDAAVLRRALAAQGFEVAR